MLSGLTPGLALRRRSASGSWNHEDPVGEVGTDDLLVPSNPDGYRRGSVEGRSLLDGDPNSRHQAQRLEITKADRVFILHARIWTGTPGATSLRVTK